MTIYAPFVFLITVLLRLSPKFYSTDDLGNTVSVIELITERSRQNCKTHMRARVQYVCFLRLLTFDRNLSIFNYVVRSAFSCQSASSIVRQKIMDGNIEKYFSTLGAVNGNIQIKKLC